MKRWGTQLFIISLAMPQPKLSIETNVLGSSSNNACLGYVILFAYQNSDDGASSE